MQYYQKNKFLFLSFFIIFTLLIPSLEGLYASKYSECMKRREECLKRKKERKEREEKEEVSVQTGCECKIEVTETTITTSEKISCSDLEDEVLKVQAKLLGMREGSENMGTLQNMYNKELAHFSILKGIKEIKDRYIIFQNQIDSGALKDKNADASLKLIEEGIEVTTHINIMEGMINEVLYDTVYDLGSEPDPVVGNIHKRIGEFSSGEDMLRKLQQNCQKMPPVKRNANRMCVNILTSWKQEDAKRLFISFYNAYSIYTEDMSQEDKKKIIDTYKASIGMGRPDGFIDREAYKDFLNEAREGLIKTQNDMKTCIKGTLDFDKCADRIKDKEDKVKDKLDDAFDNYKKKVKNFLKGHGDRYEDGLGEAAYKLAKKDYKKAKFENEFGDVTNVMKSLEQDVDKITKDTMEQTVLDNYKLIRKRNELLDRIDLDKEIKADSVDDFYKEIAGARYLNCNEKIYDDGKIKNQNLYNCLQKYSPSELDKKLNEQNNYINDIRSRIQKIQDRSDYKNLMRHKNYLMQEALIKCPPDKVRKECIAGSAVYSMENTIFGMFGDFFKVTDIINKDDPNFGAQRETPEALYSICGSHEVAVSSRQVCTDICDTYHKKHLSEKQRKENEFSKSLFDDDSDYYAIYKKEGGIKGIKRKKSGDGEVWAQSLMFGAMSMIPAGFGYLQAQAYVDSQKTQAKALMDYNYNQSLYLQSMFNTQITTGVWPNPLWNMAGFNYYNPYGMYAPYGTYGQSSVSFTGPQMYAF